MAINLITAQNGYLSSLGERLDIPDFDVECFDEGRINLTMDKFYSHLPGLGRSMMFNNIKTVHTRLVHGLKVSATDMIDVLTTQQRSEETMYFESSMELAIQFLDPSSSAANVVLSILTPGCFVLS
jgi:hypothetical protein